MPSLEFLMLRFGNFMEGNKTIEETCIESKTVVIEG